MGICPITKNQCVAGCVWYDSILEKCAILVIADSLFTLATLKADEECDDEN
jgi:hypothetical protein